ncbi:MAG: T9SS type A sorting domain-containing protein [Bacteroidales bacterium]|nr:T9SS type A sorting domain-containing protein [Bacteroidales bacterium]
MKRGFLTIVFLSVIFDLFAQDNLQIIDPSKRWSYCFHDSFIPWNFYMSYYVKFSGDTTINQLNYLKIWESEDEQYSEWYQRGFIRSDTNGNIFLRNLVNNEGLSYKFNVNPGDTFTVFNPFHYYIYTAEVLYVDSVYVEPVNEYRKRIKITDYEEPTYAQEEYWIEGIGSMAGILNSGYHVYTLTGGLVDALCQWKNNSLVYSNPSFSFCFNIVSTLEMTDESTEIFIQPNPLVNKSYIVIKGLHFDNYQLEIRDIYGKNVCRYNIQQNKDMILDRGLFKSGLYIITLIDGNNVIARKKLIVQ